MSEIQYKPHYYPATDKPLLQYADRSHSNRWALINWGKYYEIVQPYDKPRPLHDVLLSET